jgi:methylmalonyl-CoA epimerase
VTLDHVGIAVADIEHAVSFWRDALGLDVHPPEHVADQRVEVRFVAAGPAALELLAGVGPESVVTKFVQKRGPGLHHVTLRVDDIRAALARLKGQGVRLVDEEPRVGAGGALVAFVHPSSAQGVLVELTQRETMRADLTVRRVSHGGMQLTFLHDGPFRLDGGAMFGVVPRTLWERKAPADERHRIQLAMRPLLVEADWGRLLVDCGAGDKMSAKQQDIYALDRSATLPHALAQAGVGVDDITTVLATHLHFDHFGGATRRDGGALRPTFPRAAYVIREAEWGDATHPHERNRASYLQDDFVPLLDAGVVTFHQGDDQIKPGVRVVRTGGHTGQHQVVFVESGGRTAVFVADMIPTTAHLQDAWVMGYDLFPMDTLAFKRRFIREAIDRAYLIVFEHDPKVSAGYIREDAEGQRFVEAVL